MLPNPSVCQLRTRIQASELTECDHPRDEMYQPLPD
jgi:hypothetical protein